MSVLTTVTINADHPAFTGHFPDTPILPGVLLLDETLWALEQHDSLAATRWRIGRAKFLKPVHPGETLLVEHERLSSGAVRFTISSTGRLVANGMLLPLTTASTDVQQAR